MRARPVRPNIYLSVVRFGVADSDWLTVLLISCVSYLVPVPLGITVLYVPLQMWTWLLATAGSIAFFNYIRIGRRPYWLQHKLRAIFSHHCQYRSIPNGKKRSFNRAWLIDSESDGLTSEEWATPRVAQTMLLLEHHNQTMELTLNATHS